MELYVIKMKNGLHIQLFMGGMYREYGLKQVVDQILML